MGQCEVKVKRSNDELFHSDSFLGEEFSDEMYHWKYIKREKKNGKWRYYYDKEQVKEDLGVNAKKEYESAKFWRKAADEHAQFWKDNLTKRAVEYTKDGKIDYGESQALTLTGINYTYSSGEAIREAEKKVRKAASKYYKTPIGKLEKAANKGKNFIKKLFKVN